MTWVSLEKPWQETEGPSLPLATCTLCLTHSLQGLVSYRCH